VTHCVGIEQKNPAIRQAMAHGGDCGDVVF
jgi:hypothetical protein